MRRTPALFVLALALLAAAPAARAGPTHPRLREVQKELVGRLHELAQWCVAPKLFGERYDLYELILEMAPDDEVARKWNGYKDGKPKKRPGNLSKSGVSALQVWQARIIDWYIPAVEAAMGGTRPADIAAQRGAAIRLAVRLAPKNENYRKLNGEVPGKVKGSRTRWILVETARSRKRRPALRKAAQKAIKMVAKPEKVEPREKDKDSTVEWAHGFKGGKARIFGVTDADEIKQTLKNAEAAFPLFAKAFDVGDRGIRGLTLYSFDQVATGNAYLANQPDVSQQYLKFVHTLAALWIPKSTRVIIKTNQRDVRLEAGARQVMSALLQKECGISAKQGWAMEGFCLHLVWHITGTRLLNSVRQSQYGEKEEAIPDLSKRLKESGTDWMAEGRKLLQAKNAPDLRLVLGKTVNVLTPEDILYGYVLSVYLLEGHVDKLADLLRSIAAVTDADFDAPFGEHLGMDVATVEARVRRWAEETHDLK